MLNQFSDSDVHLSSPAIIALVHKASYLEVLLFFCSRTLFLHPFCVDVIHTRINIICLLGRAGFVLRLWKPNSKVESMAAAVNFRALHRHLYQTFIPKESFMDAPQSPRR
jgi:hypothetical protein